MNIISINKNRQEKPKSEIKSAGENMLDDLEQLFHDVLSMQEITPSDIYVDYFLNRRHMCKGINLHKIYKNYRRICGPEVYEILWSMFKDNEKEYLRGLLFLVSLPYIQEI